jgi:hypothetical protein
MALPEHLGNPKPLGHIVDHLDELPPSGWLMIRNATAEMNFASECYPVEIDSRDVSEEEMVAFEAALKAAGYKYFLNRDQIREVIGNLEEQRPDFTPADLERAIDFYWKRDAFVVLIGDGG